MPGSPSNPAANATQSSAICVAWAPPNWQRDAKLERELTRPGLTLFYACDDFETVALLCSDFAQHGPKSPRAMILMLVEPAMLTGLREALQALADRIPALHLWVFDAARSPVLRGITRVELVQLLDKSRDQPPKPAQPVLAAQPIAAPTWVGPMVSEGTQRWTHMATSAEAQRNPSRPNALPLRQGGPSLRLTEEPNPVRRPTQPVESPAEAPAAANPPLLTDEELNMLLGEPETKNGSNGHGKASRTEGNR